MGQNTKIAGDIYQSNQRNDHAWEVIKTLVSGETDASRLLELYYWTREPGIVELIRAYLDLPEHTRRNLGDLLLNIRPQQIHSSFDAQGRLVLAHSEAPAQAPPPARRQRS